MNNRKNYRDGGLGEALGKGLSHRCSVGCDDYEGAKPLVVFVSE